MTSGNPWATNTTAALSMEAVVFLRQTQARIVAEHGHDPCTLAQAAAHEAGHAVVCTALGDRVVGCRLFRSRARDKLLGGSAWLGTTLRDSKLHSAAVAAHEASVERLIYEALNNLAGIAGERVAGLDHPASSLDEVILAQLHCQQLDERGLAPAELLFARAVSSCIRAIKNNRRQFDMVRGHLARRRRLTQAEAHRMLAGVKELA